MKCSVSEIENLREHCRDLSIQSSRVCFCIEFQVIQFSSSFWANVRVFRHNMYEWFVVYIVVMNRRTVPVLVVFSSVCTFTSSMRQQLSLYKTNCNLTTNIFQPFDEAQLPIICILVPSSLRVFFVGITMIN